MASNALSRSGPACPELILEKRDADTDWWRPLERGRLRLRRDACRLEIADADGRVYARTARPAANLRFTVRGTAGLHHAVARDRDDRALHRLTFRVLPQTRIHSARKPFGDLARRIQLLMLRDHEQRNLVINGRLHRMLVTWGRDHVHTLKAQKFFLDDVKSGLDYWLDTQEPNGMFWDCIHPNPDYPAPTWFGEALGEGFFRYEDGGRWIVRRIPVEADCEFLYTEGVWTAWKASGDDAWMARQLPRLEKALRYNTSHPDRWSRRHRLVRRSMCMDSWDFVNPIYCHGDHRRINPGDPQFLFHGDNSGVYASHWRMAEMYEHLAATTGRRAYRRRGAELRERAERFRRRANARLFFDRIYGHMIPETLGPAEVYAKVGDERKRMSLSTGYTLNRGLPTHEMAVKILNEYRRRGRAKRGESFAEWWTMDPPYEPAQWPSGGGAGFPRGEYMNGAICPIVAGEIARAAFEHGLEGYGVDILRRVWALSERDGGHLHQAYRRLPDKPGLPRTRFTPIDLSAVVNRGLRHGAHPHVAAWTGEGDNDMRNLPVGRQRFGPIRFEVIDPARNAGRAVLRCDTATDAPDRVTVAVPNVIARSLYFLHAMAHSAPRHAPVAIYTICYGDGVEHRWCVRNGHEIGLWWGVHDGADTRRGQDPVDRSIARVAWRGPNPTWKNVGLFMTGWDNPRPDEPITGIRVEAVPAAGLVGTRRNPTKARGGVMLAAISASDRPVAYEVPIRSYGLPDNWAQAAVYYAIAEGLAGVEDTGRAFSSVRLCPRWAATESDRNRVCLHYPASGGYVSYDYRLDRRRRRLTLDVTGSFHRLDAHCLLPGDARARSVRLDGEAIPFDNAKVQRSRYVDFTLDRLSNGPIVIEYEPATATPVSRRK